MGAAWGRFFETEVGASAALTGLVFVALSINLSRIIKTPHLVSRAFEALLLLIQPVVYGLTVLAPLGHVERGALSLAFGTTFAVAVNVSLMRARPENGAFLREYRMRWVCVQLSMLSELVGCTLLVVGNRSGLGLIGFGALACVAIGIANAWVLLIEILR